MSKAMRKVDSETRIEVIYYDSVLFQYTHCVSVHQVRDKRLRSLEADNYNDDAIDENDAEYSDENV